MRYFIVHIILFVVLSTFAFSQGAGHRRGAKPQTVVDPASAAIGKVQEKVAPDRRIAVFDVTVHRSGKSVVLTGEVGSAETKAEIIEAVRKADHAEIIDSISLLPEPACLEKPFAAVRVSVAPLRDQPSESAEMVTQALMGSLLKVLKVRGGWMYVQMTEDNYLGWVDVAQCVRQTQADVDRWMNGPLIITTAYFDLVRMEPSDSAQPVCDVITGAILEGKDHNQEWFAVILPDGRTGFLQKKSGMNYAQWKASRNPTAENIEKTAKIYLGVPYLWGGTSPKGFDCSGFAKTVFKLNGIALQRDADQQGMEGAPVPLENDLSQLQKGDLLFFGSRQTAERRERITHVAIYLGKKEFIHCSGLVKFNSFDPSSPLYSEYLLKRLVKAKRFLPGN